MIGLLFAVMVASCQTEEIPELSGEEVTGLTAGTRLIPTLISVYQGEEFKGTIEPVYDYLASGLSFGLNYPIYALPGVMIELRPSYYQPLSAVGTQKIETHFQIGLRLRRRK